MFPLLIAKVNASDQQMGLPTQKRVLLKQVSSYNDTVTTHYLSDCKMLGMLKLRKFLKILEWDRMGWDRMGWDRK